MKQSKKKSKITSFSEHGKRKQPTKEKLPLKKRILINVSAVIIAIVLILIGSFVLSEIQRRNTGFTDKNQLITAYFTGLNNADKNTIKTCFYPTRIDTSDDVKAQIEYAESESESTTWKPSEIDIEWSDMDKTEIQNTLTNIQIDEASQCVVFVPLEQTLANGMTVLEEDVYQFYVHKTKDRWYIAAFTQTARNVTGAIREDGTKMTDKETSEWLASLAVEIGSDTVGYLYVDNYWSEVVNEDYADDDQIKTYITSDYSSYLTMAVIKDTDVDDFHEYSANIIKSSSQNYGDIITSDGVIGDYKTDVQIAQNTDTGARIIVWTFKVSENDEFTHVITLEAFSDYDASTYINTFHLTREKESDATEEPKTKDTKTE